MYRRSGRGDLDVRALLTAPLAAQRMVRLQQWVFVQKCLLERKRSYLTEKGLFSRKAIAEGPKVSLALRWRGESAANSSLKRPKFPVSRENTGNFIRFEARHQTGSLRANSLRTRTG